VTWAGAGRGRLLGAICALHAGGFGLGYAVSRAVGVPERQARTNSIEVGMQNSALGAVRARRRPGKAPLVCTRDGLPGRGPLETRCCPAKSNRRSARSAPQFCA